MVKFLLARLFLPLDSLSALATTPLHHQTYGCCPGFYPHRHVRTVMFLLAEFLTRLVFSKAVHGMFIVPPDNYQADILDYSLTYVFGMEAK